MQQQILVVDDDPFIHGLVHKIIEHHYQGRWKTVHSKQLTDAIELFKKETFQIAIIDLMLTESGLEGLQLIKSFRSEDPVVEILVMSSLKNFELVIQAIQNGANDYIPKGFATNEFLFSLDRAFERRKWKKIEQNHSFKQRNSLDKIIGDHSSIIKLKENIKKLANKKIPILILGETGTGKEMVASLLHELSDNHLMSFIPVNCAAIPASLAESFFFGHEKGAFTGAIQKSIGIFEQVDGGTLFLDEINSLSLELQAKLLRVIQEKEFKRVGSSKTQYSDFRLVCASNVELIELVKKGKFREDLYYRVSPVSLNIPPLRERKKDISLLVSHFLNGTQCEKKLLTFLEEYSWPGNIRELKNLLMGMEALSKTSGLISYDDLPEHIFKKMEHQAIEDISLKDLKRNSSQIEKQFLSKAYQKAQCNISRLARELKLDRSHLHQKLVRLGIHKKKKES